MTLKEIIESAVAVACAGLDPDTAIAQKLRAEAEPMMDLALHELAIMVRGNQRLRVRLTKEFSVTLVNGFGAFPATALVEFIGEGIVRDGDSGAGDGFGNILQRVLNEADFRGYLLPLYGYYLIKANTTGVSEIHTRQVITGSFVDTITPLTVTMPYVPAKADLNAAVNSEIADDLVRNLALKLRGAVAVTPDARI